MHHLPRSTQTLRYLALLIPSLLLTGCITAVVSPEQEARPGSEMSQQVAEQIGLYRDPGMERYVSAVGKRLVDALGETPYTFKFSVVDQFEPNAFASPGGYIYVSRALLAQLNSEAELAGALAHEIGHVTRRHHARQESEADQYGMKLASTAGYEPLALAQALEGIERSVQLLTAGPLTSYVTTTVAKTMPSSCFTYLSTAPGVVSPLWEWVSIVSVNHFVMRS